MKRNLTLVVPGDLLRLARVKAVREETSVNEVVRRALEAYVGRRNRQVEAVEALLRIADGAGGRMGPRKWKRADLHDRRSPRG